MRLAAVIAACLLAGAVYAAPGGQRGFYQAWWGTQGFDPSSLAGLVAWYDASDPTTVSVQAGTTNITAWADKSVSGVTLTVPAAVYPKYNLGALNGLNGVTFSGAANDYLRANSASIYSNKPYAYTFAVAKHTGGGSYRAIYKVTTAAGTDRSSAFARSTGVLEVGGRRLDANAYQFVQTPFATNTVKVLSGFFQWSDAALTAGVNLTYTNRAGGFQTAGNSDATPSAFVAIGGSDLLAGEVYEVISYDRKLTDDEISKINNYLATKWGIEL